MVKVEEVALKFSNVEKDIFSLKKELDRLLEDKRNKEKDIASSKEIIDKLIYSYEKKIKEKIKEISKEKEYSLNLVKSYENKLKEKDEEIEKIILTSDDSPVILKSLKDKGISKDIYMLNKSELCISFDKLLKEHKKVLDKLNVLEEENKRIKYEFKISKVSFNERIDKINSDLNIVNKDRNNFEKDNILLKKEIISLKNNALDLIKGYDKKISDINKQSEERILKVIDKASKSDIEFKSKILLLEKEIEDYRKVIYDSKNTREEMLKVIEQRIKESISPIVLDAVLKSEKNLIKK